MLIKAQLDIKAIKLYELNVNSGSNTFSLSIKKILSTWIIIEFEWANYYTHRGVIIILLQTGISIYIYKV